MRLPVNIKSLLLLPLAGLVSCTNLCQNAADFGADYSGVVLTDPGRYVCHGGKYYVMGQRARFRRTHVNHPFDIGKPCPDQFVVKAGSPGEFVCREIRLRGADGKPQCAEGSTWIPLDLRSEPTLLLPPCPLSGLTQEVKGDSRELTAHALYAYPLSVATFAFIDLPLNLATPVLMVGVVPVAIVYDMVRPRRDSSATTPETEP